MILHTDGSAPLLMIALMIIYFFIYKKEQKESKIRKNNIEMLELHADECEKLSDLIKSGRTTIYKNDFKHLKKEDFQTYASIYSSKNLKFV